MPSFTYIPTKAIVVFLSLSKWSCWYRGADKSLPDPTEKKQLKDRRFLSEAEVIAAAETWLDGQTSELLLSGLQKLEFGRCSLFPSWSG